MPGLEWVISAWLGVDVCTRLGVGMSAGLGVDVCTRLGVGMYAWLRVDVCLHDLE